MYNNLHMQSMDSPTQLKIIPKKLDIDLYTLRHKSYHKSCKNALILYQTL